MAQRILGSLIGADLSNITEQTLTLDSTKYIITGIYVTNVSAPKPSGGRFAVFTGSAHTGDAVIANASLPALADQSQVWDLVQQPGVPGQNGPAGRIYTAGTLYFSMLSVIGSGLTADFHFVGFDVP